MPRRPVTSAVAIVVALVPALEACDRAPSPSIITGALGEETGYDYVGDLSITRRDDGLPSTPMPDGEFDTPHPHSPWTRLRLDITCPACADMNDPTGAATHAREAFDVALVAVTPSAAVRVFDWLGTLPSGGAPLFWELPTLSRYRLEVTSPSFYEPETFGVHTGASRAEQRIILPMVPGRALGRGVTAVRADGLVLHITTDGRIVRPVPADNPFALDLVTTTPGPEPRPLRAPKRAIFAPSGDLLVEVANGWRVVDGQTFDLLEGRLPPLAIAAFSHGESRRAIGRLARVNADGDTRQDPIVVGWANGRAEVLAIESISTETDDRGGLAISGDGRVFGWVTDGFPASRRVDGTFTDYSFQANQTPPPFSRLFLGHDGETHYVLFHDGGGGMTLWVNGRSALVGVQAFAVSRTRPGAVAITRGFGQNGDYLYLNVHVPGRIDEESRPWAGGWDKTPYTTLSAAQVLTTCGADPDPALADFAPLDTRYDIADVTQPPGFAGAETLVATDGDKTVVLDAATGAERFVAEGFWTCFRRSDDSVVLREGYDASGQLVRQCPTAGALPVVQSDTCELISLEDDGSSRRVDLVADGLPLGGGRSLRLRPTCATHPEPCGEAMVVRPDGTRLLLGLTGFGSADPTRHLDATCVPVPTDRGVFCAR